MGLSSSTLQPEELATFRNLPESVTLEDIEIPESPENRRSTDGTWLIILGIITLLLLPFTIYTLSFSEISRLTAGYDKCGNICGMKNYKWGDIECSGQDMSNLSYYYSNETVPYGECSEKNSQGYNMTDMQVYFSGVKWQLFISCLISILIAIGMLFLFRYALCFVVWSILTGCFLGLLALSFGFWFVYVVTPYTYDIDIKHFKSTMLFLGVFFTILAMIMGIGLIWFKKKIHLVILIFKETTNAVFDMPGLIAIPLFSAFAVGILISIFAITALFLVTAGTLQNIKSEYYDYVKNNVMKFTLPYSLFIYSWMIQFFTGIQYMIIAGAIAKWYFCRDKSSLGNPIVTSVTNTFKFHLGTIAMGTTIIQILKVMILKLMENGNVQLILGSCVHVAEKPLAFLSKNGYIISAIHGQDFLKSGKRAAELIFQNLGDIVAVSYVSDFILGIIKVVVVVVSVLLSTCIFKFIEEPVANPLLPGHMLCYIIVGVFASVVALLTFGVFEVGINSIFICYCEDKLLNDGITKPYFMSSNLTQFILESNEIFRKK